jgi:hypothetical protein
MSNVKFGMGCAPLTLWADVGINAGTFVGDGRPKNPADALIWSLRIA